MLVLSLHGDVGIILKGQVSTNMASWREGARQGSGQASA